MTDAPRVGLLPLYLELYDQRRPDMRKSLEPFLAQVIQGLRAQGVEVLSAPISRTGGEVAAAVAQIESARVDAIVTLHLAYSPSLNAAEPLAVGVVVAAYGVTPRLVPAGWAALVAFMRSTVRSGSSRERKSVSPDEIRKYACVV